MLLCFHNTVTQSNISQEKKWSWQTTSVTFHPEKKHANRIIPKHTQLILYTRKFNIVRGAVRRDPIHSTMYTLTLNGCADRIQEVPHIACHFWGTRDELTIENGVLLKGRQSVHSPELYERTLGELCNNCRGIEKMRHLSQTTIY